MRLALRRVVIAVAVLLAWGVAENAFCLKAEASYGYNDALQTIGISAGIGTVVGLSTIAFYDSPTSHLSNALMGAGAGLVMGLGVAAYMLANASEDDEINPEEVLPPQNRPDDSGKTPGKDPSKTKSSGEYRMRPLRSLPILASVPAALALRDTRQWVVAVRVLELRF